MQASQTRHHLQARPPAEGPCTSAMVRISGGPTCADAAAALCFKPQLLRCMQAQAPSSPPGRAALRGHAGLVCRSAAAAGYRRSAEMHATLLPLMAGAVDQLLRGRLRLAVAQLQPQLISMRPCFPRQKRRSGEPGKPTFSLRGKEGTTPGNARHVSAAKYETLEWGWMGSVAASR